MDGGNTVLRDNGVEMGAPPAYFWATLGIYCAIWLPTFYLWCKSFDLAFFQFRVPLLFLISSGSNLFYMTVLCYFLATGEGCNLVKWTSYVVIVTLGHTYIYRGMLLVYHSYLNNAKLFRLEKDEDFWFRQKWITNPKVIIIFHVIYISFYIGLVAINEVYGKTPNWHPEQCLGPSNYFFTMFYIVYGGIVGALALVIIPLRKDPYFIKYEMLICFAGTGAGVIMFVIWFIHPMPQVHQWWISWFPVLFSILIVNQAIPSLITLPFFRRMVGSFLLRHVISNHSHSGFSGSGSHPSAQLSQIEQEIEMSEPSIVDDDKIFWKTFLDNSNPAFTQDFLAFAAEIWAAENVLFLRQLNELKKEEKSSPEDLKKSILKILHTFIVTGSDLEINLDDTARKKIITQVEVEYRYDIDVFRDAQRHILHMVTHHIIPKYRSSGRLNNFL